MNKIRKGDQVIVTTGRDKGKQGTVTAILEQKVLVEGVNQYKKNVKLCRFKFRMWLLLTQTVSHRV